MFALPDIASGLLCGALFGYVLENAGFGSPCKLTAQFRLTDWSVFKVMFTAIVVAAVGLTALTATGVVAAAQLYVPAAFLGAAAIGGALVGAGFAIGGYCPGTSVVGLVSGRIDAVVFFIGLLLGTGVFAGGFGALEAWTTSGELASADTLPALLHVSPWVVDAAMVAAAVFVFWLAARFERRGAGPVTAEQAVAGAQATSAAGASSSSLSMTSP
ncbi:YeeE/YedE family protein [Ramlibacter ginsenosidimutans]|uniref:YeeE/YedE family protein n=1 Tax=Ramlibacter ginsenosidimutans TaxID=502333 RepID=A0A934TQ20_9BURK|nr:YeeE/YedE thiosulfate transporter family protein [Ramlibacter ginsenosidimutans]MBK6005203.1 YeeE/YedE family protein [Ramlibacter ginsenosidimutans]